jgi:anthranilate phosphoribosyltransferase
VPRYNIEDLKGGNREENARLFLRALSAVPTNNNNNNQDHPYAQLSRDLAAQRYAICLNAALGCYVYGISDSIESGFHRVRTVLDAGTALQTLETWKASSQLQLQSNQST